AGNQIDSLHDWAVAAHFAQRNDFVERLIQIPDAYFRMGVTNRQEKFWREPAALEKLLDKGELHPEEWSPHSCQLVGSLLRESARKTEWYRRAVAEHPTDFWLNYQYGSAIAPARPQEAAIFYRIALAVRPSCSEARARLGRVLAECGQVNEAVRH